MRWRKIPSASRKRPPGIPEPCSPIRAQIAPSGPAWIHEIKHDGYRLMVRKDGQGVRIFTRRGYDWSDRYPLIAAGAARLEAVSFTIDGEGVVCRPDGVADFAMLQSRQHDRAAFLYAFDLLELDGEDLRAAPLEERKARLAKLLAGSKAGIVYSEHVEFDGPAVFAAACKMGLEGIISKRRDKPYQPGPCKHWIKVKNPDAPAMRRLVDDDLSK